MDDMVRGLRYLGATCSVGCIVLASCAELFSDPVQCRTDGDCERFPGSRCDVGALVCVVAAAAAAPDAAGAPAPSSTSSARPDSSPDATIDAGCGPTDSDAHNCGQCGHDCLGGTCASGSCGPVVLASAQRQPAYVALDGEFVYWTNSGDGTIAKVPIAGGTPQVIAIGAAPRVWTIFASRVGVFWTENGGSRVAGVPLDGGIVATLAEGQDAPRGIVSDGTRVYWTNEGNDAGFVESAEPDGGGLEILSPQQAGSKDIAVQAGWLYFANAGDGTVVRMQTDGGAASAIVSNHPNAFGLTVDSNNVYFTTHTTRGVVAQAKLDGTGLVNLAIDQAVPRAIATDGTAVYWTNESDGTVRRAHVGGGSVTTLATGQRAPWGIAVDGSAVYWAERLGGKVYRLAK
jgi:hypothetical protein